LASVRKTVRLDVHRELRAHFCIAGDPSAIQKYRRQGGPIAPNRLRDGHLPDLA
jgi:hypothetical protein